MNNDYLDQSNNLISDILRQAVSGVSDKWDSVTLEVRFAEGVVELKPNYIKEGEKHSISVPKEVIRMLSKLKELNSSEEKGTLKGALFHITSDGKFNVKYDY